MQIIIDNNQNKYYLYRHIRLDKNNVFYVGIGTKPEKFGTVIYEYYRAFSKTRRSVFWRNIINKTEYKVDILFEHSDYNFIKQKEIEFIKLYGRRNIGEGDLVNLTDGGEGMLNYITSELTKDKIRKKRLGTKATQETIDKMIKSRTGKKFSLTHRNNSANAHKKSIIQMDLNENFIKEWTCMTEASDILNININGISACCNNRLNRKSSGGYKWKFK